MDKKKMRRAPLLIATAAVLPVMLGACSSGSSSSDAPSSAQGGAGSSDVAQNGQAQFAQCMRQNGVTNFPDPQNGHFLMTGNIQNNPHFQSAIQTCQHFMGPGGLGSNSKNNQQAELAFVQCMQTHGVPNMPEPASNGAIQAPQGAGVDPNSPTYQKAFNECRSKLPGDGNGLEAGGNGSGQ